MNAFPFPAHLRMLDDYRWQLLTPFEYHFDTQGKPQKIVVPAGTITDLASIPRFLWSIFPPQGKWAKAAIIHDYLYDQAIGSKQWADKVFFEAMTVLGVARWCKYIVYWAVCLFGKGNYSPDRHT